MSLYKNEDKTENTVLSSFFYFVFNKGYIRDD